MWNLFSIAYVAYMFVVVPFSFMLGNMYSGTVLLIIFITFVEIMHYLHIKSIGLQKDIDELTKLIHG